jgi:acetyltransferase
MIGDFFNSKSFAVVGAAREEEKVGHIVLKNLLANKGLKVFPVNPNAVSILGQKCYRDLLEIPFSIDCVVVCVKAEFVPSVVQNAGNKKVKSMIIISAGFSEAGNSKLEQEVLELARKYDITLLGPNVFGIIDTSRGMNSTFFEGMPKKGGLSLISQSGALGVGILDIALKEGIGFSSFVSMGNSSLVSFSDFIDYFSKDKETRVIGLYIESLRAGQGKEFIETCKRCRKPIVAIKAGKSSRGEKAAASHTAALASEQGVYEGIFKQAGIIEVSSISQLLSVSQILEKYGKIGKRACIVTNAGGLGVLCTDYCSEQGIEIVELPSSVMERMNKLLPPGWSHNNPLDVIGDALADRYKQVLELLDKENWFDFFIVLLTPQYMTQPFETAQILPGLKKPAFACFYGGEKVEQANKFMAGKIFSFSELRDMAESLGKVV